MDSLTQIVLGAACGEAVLGKKIGNKALIWGAVGGTIPDLDVLSSFVMGELDALSFHRGPMHSLLFACIAPFPLAWLVMKFYEKSWFNQLTYRRIGFVNASLFFLLMFFALQMAFLLFLGKIALWMLALIIPALYFIFRNLYRDYLQRDQEFPEAKYKEWVLLFFVSIFTHPLLDSLTTYGTRLFWPFSDTRVSLSTVSIVDPLYTVPFLFSVLLCGFYFKGSNKRQLALWIGIIYSSMYLMATAISKWKVESSIHDRLSSAGINPDKCLSVPTIFNSVLWYHIAREDSVYYCSYYSLFDKHPDQNPIHKVNRSFYKVEEHADGKVIKTLDWFSDGFACVMQTSEDSLQWNDLRFGTMNFNFERAEDFVFHFNLVKKNDSLTLAPNFERPRMDEDQRNRFWNRVLGNP